MITETRLWLTASADIPDLKKRRKDLEIKPEFVNGRFVNSPPRLFTRRRNRWSLLGEMMMNKKQRIPNPPPAQQQLQGECLRGAGESLRVTWLGHSSVAIEIDGQLVLVDPMFSRRASPLPFIGPKRFNRRPAVMPRELPFVHGVIISHDHYDHLDKWSVKQLKNKVGMFHVPLNVGRHLARWGVPREKIREYSWWDSWQGKAGPEFIAAPGQHFSGRGLYRNNTLWASWVIRGSRHRVFISGDGGYWPAFGEIGRRYGPFDVTLMECGQYNESWAHVHLMPEETVQAHIDVGGKILVPVHWGSFSISLHSWTEPVERLTAAAELRGVTVALPPIGGQFVFGQPLPQERWWENGQA